MTKGICQHCGEPLALETSLGYHTHCAKILNMNKELESLLSTYLGELLYKLDTTFDWIERGKVTERINAVNVLLGIPCKMEGTMQRLHQFIKDEAKKNKQ
jgi:hypothetical protein